MLQVDVTQHAAASVSPENDEVVMRACRSRHAAVHWINCKTNQFCSPLGMELLLHRCIWRLPQCLLLAFHRIARLEQHDVTQ
jgi:hypothetical protein